MMLAAVAAFVPISQKTVAHVDLLDRQTVVVCWSDASATIAPLDSVSWGPGGPQFSGWRTDIAAPTSDVLVTSWLDVRGLTRTVTTNCVTLQVRDCVIQHQKAVDLMLAAAPAKSEATK